MRRSVRNTLKFGVPVVALGLVGLMLVPAQPIRVGAATFVPPGPAATPAAAPNAAATRIRSLSTPTPLAAKLEAELQAGNAAAPVTTGVKPAVELVSNADGAAPDVTTPDTTTLPAATSADLQSAATPPAAGSDNLNLTDTSNLPTEQVGPVAVNLRSDPSVSDNKVSVLQPGESVRVGETSGNWVHVYRQDGTDGWVYGSYLAGSANGGAPAGNPGQTAMAPAPQRPAQPSRLPPPQTASMARLTSVVPLLQRPDDFGTTLGVLQPGERVRVLNSDGRWLHVVTEDGADGWIPA
jgi:SH3-like domain-containing protein